MSATVTRHEPRSAARTGPRGSFLQLLAMEWTKLRSPRSTMWILLITAVATLGFTLITALRVRDGVNADEAAMVTGDDIVNVTLPALSLIAPLFVIALGALAITSEYSSGMIRTTLVAVPERARMMAAKAVVLAASIWVFGAVLTLATWAIAGLTLPYGFDASAGATVQMLAGSPVWLAVVAVLTFGFATALRSTAGVITWVVGLLHVLPGILPAIAQDVSEHVSPYLPNAAATVMLTGEGDDVAAVFGPWTALVVLSGWVVVALAAGYGVLKKRDA